MMCDACEKRLRELVEAMSETSARVEVSWTCKACGQVRYAKKHVLDIPPADSDWPILVFGMVGIALMVGGAVISHLFGANP